MPPSTRMRASIAAARRSLGDWLNCVPGRALGVLLAALMGFGWYAAPLTAATVAAEGPEVRVVGRLTLQLSAPDQREFMQKTLEMAAITHRQDQLTSYSSNGEETRTSKPGGRGWNRIWRIS